MEIIAYSQGEGGGGGIISCNLLELVQVCVYLQLDQKKARAEGKQCHAVLFRFVFFSVCFFSSFFFLFSFVNAHC
jgi:hypothetical protein